MLQQGLPDDVAALFGSAATQGRVVLLAAATDVDLDGNPADQWFVATEKELLLVERGEPARILQELALDETTAFRTTPAVGSGFLQARVDGAWVDLVRYSNRLSGQFTPAAQKLERLIQQADFEVEADDQAPDAACPSCGVRLRFPGDNCPRCLPHHKIAKRVWRLMRPYRGAAALMFGLSLVAVAVELIPPLLQKMLVDRVLEGDEPRGDFGELLWLLLALVAGLAAVRFVAALIGIWKGSLSSRIGTSLTADLRAKMVRKLHELSVAYYDRNQTGMLMSRVSYDTEAMHTLMHQVTSGFILQLLQLVGIGVMLFWLNPKLAFYTMLPMPLVVAGSWFFTRYLHPRHHRYWESVGRQAAALTGMLSGIRVVKAFAQENREYHRFERSSHRLRDVRQQVDFSTATFSSLIGFTFGLGALIVWYVGGRDVLTEDMTLGSLMAFIAYLAMFYTPLTSLTESTTWISNFLTASQRIFELLDTPSHVQEPARPHHVEAVQGHVRLNRVCFAYDDQRPILKNVSLEAQPGEMIGIVGRSGSGKSTLVSLISRMYDATSGSVTIDGVNVRDIASRDLRRHVGMVLQEPFLFEGTVAENITYGRPDAAPEQILTAAKSAAAHDFILRMPFGYETVIGERGAGLSGGERQRLSIARALLYDPRILILDEATSSVDTESERIIQEAIRRFSKGRTTIAIAHRLSTLRNADRLFAFDQGHLIEQGTHDELIARNGVYASLVRIQSGARATPALAAVTSGGGPELPPGDEPEPWSAETPAEPEPPVDVEFELRWLTPHDTEIRRDPRGVLSVTRFGQTHRGVSTVRAFPSQYADEFISVQSHDEHGGVVEVGMIRRLADWPDDVRELLAQSLRRRYLLRTVLALHSLRADRGFLRCVAETDCGTMDFLLHVDGSSIKSYGLNGCLMIDVDENHYVVPDVDRLPSPGREALTLHLA